MAEPTVYDGRHRRYLRCPDCGQHSVWLRIASEDWWVCRNRNCLWSACDQGNDPTDVVGRTALINANPGRADVPWHVFDQCSVCGTEVVLKHGFNWCEACSAIVLDLRDRVCENVTAPEPEI